LCFRRENNEGKQARCWRVQMFIPNHAESALGPSLSGTEEIKRIHSGS
jgi:hypothetical protein